MGIISDTIHDDINPDQIETLPDTQIHRGGLELIKADKEGTLDNKCLPWTNK